MPRSSSRSRLLSAVAVTAVAGFALAGCSGTADSGSSTKAKSTATASDAAAPNTGGSAQVKVTLTGGSGSDACTIDHTSAAAGPVTFTIQNQDSTAISEVELLNDQRIVGEKENLAPGLDAVSFTVTLTGGKYQVYCPGAETEMQDFTVTGEAATPTGGIQDELKQGTVGYGKYVDDQINTMVQTVETLKKAVDSGDLTAAQKAYGLARPYYERVESDVDGFVLPGFKATDNAGNLDYLIDMRKSNLDPKVGWHGFHAVEKDLFQAKAITGDTKKLAAELDSNVKKLQSLSKGLTYAPEDLANGAAGLLEEVQTNKVSGEEENYSHIDLVDFAGNVEGAQQAFEFLRPALAKIDSGLTTQVNDEFDTVNKMLDAYRDPSAIGGYKTYTAQLKASDATKLSQAVAALHSPLSKIAQKVATAQ